MAAIIANRTNQWRIAFNLYAQFNPLISQHEEQFLKIMEKAVEEYFFEPECIDSKIIDNLEILMGVNASNIARTYESIARQASQVNEKYYHA